MDAMYEVFNFFYVRRNLVKSLKRNIFHFSNTFLSGFTSIQIPDIRTGSNIIDAAIVDEDAAGHEGHRYGAKLLYGKGALEQYLSQEKTSKYQQV